MLCVFELGKAVGTVGNGPIRMPDPLLRHDGRHELAAHLGLSGTYLTPTRLAVNVRGDLGGAPFLGLGAVHSDHGVQPLRRYMRSPMTRFAGALNRFVLGE